MEAKELLQLPVAELEKQLDDAQREMFNLRFQKAQRKLTDTNGVRRVRRNIARINTVLRQRQIAAAQARATFINPATGERRKAGAYRTGNLNDRTFPDGQTQFFTTPGHWEDAVLLLEAAGQGAR